MVDGLPPEAAPPALESDTPVGAAAPQGFPVRVAAIDVGSNAIRFIAAEFGHAVGMTIVDQLRTPVRLGRHVFQTGRLEPAALEDAVRAMASFRERIDTLGVTRFRAVATSAVRDSGNGEDLRRRVLAETGIPLEIISGDEEARLVHRAVRTRMSLGDRRWILADLGGGSVEISLVDAEQIHWTMSQGIGAVRLLDAFSDSGDDPARFRRRLAVATSPLSLRPADGGEAAGFIATGGNIEALARLTLNARARNGAAILPLDRLRDTIETLARRSYRQRIEELGLREDRADVILPAALLYECLCRLAGFDDLHIPFVGVKEGLLFDLAEEGTDGEPAGAGR